MSNLDPLYAGGAGAMTEAWPVLDFGGANPPGWDGATPIDCRWVGFERSTLRAAGGGQPADRGWLEGNDGVLHEVKAVHRAEGRTWLLMPIQLELVNLKNGPIHHVDAGFRLECSRAHTLTHVIMGCLKRQLNGFESRGATISEDASKVDLRYTATVVTDDDVGVALAGAQSAILSDLPVTIAKAKSPEQARATYPLFRMDPDLGLSGKIRLVLIHGLDANPCSGTHISHLGLVGGFSKGSVSTSGMNHTLTVYLSPKPATATYNPLDVLTS